MSMRIAKDRTRCNFIGFFNELLTFFPFIVHPLSVCEHLCAGPNMDSGQWTVDS